MKDYERQILWLDYFNSSLSRSKGRRVPTNQAVKNPTLEELVKAATRLAYKPERAEAYHPKRFPFRSGYISIEKKKSKSATIREIATMLSVVRGEARAEAKGV